MKSFSHNTPALRIEQGADCFRLLASEIDRVASRRVAVLCGATLGRPDSPLARVTEALGARCVGVYSGVRVDSPLSAVEDAVAEVRRLQADAIVAVGGGSAITTARAVAILLAEKARVQDLCTHRQGDGKLISPKLLEPKMPVFNVPTTPTTAAVKAGSAVLDPVEGRRLALFDPKARARAVFVHPELIASSPRRVFVGAGLNTLTLVVECLMSPRGDPIADALLLHALRMSRSLLPSAASGDDPQVRADLVIASILCGQGSDYTGAGMTIPIGHALSTRFHVGMGMADAVVLPHVLRFNAEASPAGIDKLAFALGVHAVTFEARVDAVVDALNALFADLGVPSRLRDTGIPKESLADIAAICFDDWFLQSNPRPIKHVDEVQQVLEQAW